MPAAKSDKVAELALSCCKTLLERCCPQNGERALELLQRIGAVAALSRAAAAEEVCSNIHEITNSFEFFRHDNHQTKWIAPLMLVPKMQVRHAALECLVALLATITDESPATAQTLQSEASTPLVAAIAMMLQEAASAEAGAGLHGSKAVRLSALRALRLLYEAVNDAQALSYVLPGAVGGLSKALLQGVHFSLGPLPSSCCEESLALHMTAAGVNQHESIKQLCKVIGPFAEQY